jgi:hypothetical protein
MAPKPFVTVAMPHGYDTVCHAATNATVAFFCPPCCGGSSSNRSRLPPWCWRSSAAAAAAASAGVKGVKLLNGEKPSTSANTDDSELLPGLGASCPAAGDAAPTACCCVLRERSRKGDSRQGDSRKGVAAAAARAAVAAAAAWNSAASAPLSVSTVLCEASSSTLLLLRSSCAAGHIVWAVPTYICKRSNMAQHE